MLDTIRYLLLQIRNSDDPMCGQEIECFVRVLECRKEQISAFDLLAGEPSRVQLDRCDIVLLGGSGHYSVASEGAWLDRALDSMRLLHDTRKPTFSSCWGFQAMARAMGGEVIRDRSRAELGTHTLFLTEEGKEDPVFGPLGDRFRGQMGHEDIVVTLPPDAERLASTVLVENQAFRFHNAPIYCTQFHPELDRASLLERVRVYPEYVEKVSGMTVERFDASCEDTPDAEAILRRFVQHVLQA